MINGDILGQRTRISPATTALVDVATGRRLTYNELNLRAVAFAAMWQTELALAAGDRVGILSDNRLEMFDAFFAVGKSGVILVPLGTRLTANELAVIVEDCELSALMFDGAHVETITQLQSLVDIENWIPLDESTAQGYEHYQELIDRSDVDSAKWPQPGPEDPYCLLYTSGTTGLPKGVITPHRQIVWNAYHTVLCWQLSESDTSPIFMPLYHAGGLGAFLIPIIAAGGRIVLHRGFDMEEIWRTIESERCTVVLGVPTIWKMLAGADGFANTNLDHVRFFTSGGAPLPRHVIDTSRERGVVMRQGYGLTEVGVNCFTMSNDEAWTKAGSIGRPLMFTEAKLIDEKGHTVAVGDVGELLFKGPHVSLGYWNNQQATAAALDDDGWFHTGDMARRDEDGFYYIAGRAKDMFISGGVNVYPAEIESQLLLHERIDDAAVIGVDDSKWGEIGVVYVISTDDVSCEELISFLEKRIARFKILKHFVFVDDLPRTAYGKVIKADLAEHWKREQGKKEHLS